MSMNLIDSCITQLKAQGPSRTWNESNEEEEAVNEFGSLFVHSNWMKVDDALTKINSGRKPVHESKFIYQHHRVKVRGILYHAS